MGYLIDSNILIRSKNEMPYDLWPSFWIKMSQLISEGKIFTSTKVKNEIEQGKDELVDWLRNTAIDSFYIPVDNDILAKYSDVQNWAMNNPIFSQGARQVFATVADAYLIATAAAKGMTIVTYETSDPTCKRRIKIPDACMALGVNFCDLNTLFRNLGVTI